MLFANIKGVPRKDVHSAVAFMLEHMDLKGVENRVSGSLSGGNKRKLSAAIAFLGDPPVIFLGEQISRGVWNVLHTVFMTLFSTFTRCWCLMCMCACLCTDADEPSTGMVC
jgi:ABC-type Na+ transport system ATPase subunit NatA